MRLLWNAGWMELLYEGTIDYLNIYIDGKSVKLDISYIEDLDVIDRKHYVPKVISSTRQHVERTGVIIYPIPDSVPHYKYITIQKCVERIVDLIYNTDDDSIDIDEMINKEIQ